ncbi:hypothetical protein ACG33_08865 [Steroidobacter denitrificans]|uniref:Uncharacterized protein n=1 Tax=Steroidobacter denitrificans TaxID=465721 RepID=A0A127F9V7_STEDE|nr:hypothetical protein [Steroidobacter denitrificans]AMN47202.1 hypothetical protein ACG33_08865 [Steroidobacter denitrificans]
MDPARSAGSRRAAERAVLSRAAASPASDCAALGSEASNPQASLATFRAPMRGGLQGIDAGEPALSVLAPALQGMQRNRVLALLGTGATG